MANDQGKVYDTKIGLFDFLNFKFGQIKLFIVIWSKKKILVSLVLVYFWRLIFEESGSTFNDNAMSHLNQLTICFVLCSISFNLVPIYETSFYQHHILNNFKK